MRRSVWVAAPFLVLLSNAHAAERRPNVVLIVADDLGWSDLGVYGSTFHRTPNLDRLAATGKRFTQAYAACPVCSPTRAALMTGKYPARLNLTDWLPGKPDGPSQKLKRPAFRQELPLEEVTLAEALKGAGYTTALVGKWHLGGVGFGPKDQGFDLNVAGDAAGSPLSYFAPFRRGARSMPGLENAPDGQYLTDRLTDEAVRFIKSHRSKPFFLYVPYYAVHTPMSARPDLVAGFPKWDGTPHGRQENPVYAAMLRSLDEGVGRIAGAVTRGDTVVIFTSDNGGLATREGANTPATNNAPLREGKGWLYEGGLRVPLIVNGPGINPGVEDTPVWSADLFETVAEYGGWEGRGKTDGVSLVGLLAEGKPLEPRPLFWHYPHYSNQGGRPGGAVREGDWKLIEDDETGRRELFNVVRDVKEATNLADREPKKVEELAAMLADWRKAVGARGPTPNPGYSPNPQAANGTITLPARTAEVHGAMLRYEPLPHKNTLGFWVRADDWASWEFDVKAPGTFAVKALVGCGKGSGGSEVEFRVAGEVLRLTVPVTGGFQAFEPLDLGRVTIGPAGRARLEVRATSKPGSAVMDLREVTLTPVGPGKM
ncbi:MAG: sulfatase-like hydrolase/transferase [Planctomycetia bacterium]|nr:sulfatase-like hydrolase/transferase [Planctomycetia bacterium]